MQAIYDREGGMLTQRVAFLQPDKGTQGIQNNPGTLRKLPIKLRFLRILVIKDSFSLVLAGLCIKGHATDVTQQSSGLSFPNSYTDCLGIPLEMQN